MAYALSIFFAVGVIVGACAATIAIFLLFDVNRRGKTLNINQPFEYPSDTELMKLGRGIPAYREKSEDFEDKVGGYLLKH